MALNIRKVAAQRAENNQKNHKKDNFYIISIGLTPISGNYIKTLSLNSY